MPRQSLPATTANALWRNEQKLNLSPRRLAAQAIESGDRAAFVEDVEGVFRNGLGVYGQRGATCFHEGGVIAPQCALDRSASALRFAASPGRARRIKGGWNAFFFFFFDRSNPNTNPYGNTWIRADGLAAFDGWPTSPRIEALRAAWLDAGDLDEQRRICAELQMQLWQDVPYIPMGEYWQATAYRKDLLDVVPGCFAVFYGVRRA